MWPQGGSLAQHISFGTTRVTISGRLTRLLLALVRLPGYLFNLITFRAQQIMLGNTATKLVPIIFYPTTIPNAQCMHAPVMSATNVHASLRAASCRGPTASMLLAAASSGCSHGCSRPGTRAAAPFQ